MSEVDIVVTVDSADTIAGLEALKARLDSAVRQSVADAAHIVQAAGMGFAPVGTPGNTTNMPGDLRRSIMVDGPVGDGGTWAARVGPTVIYGRQRELGGHIYPHHSFLRFVQFGVTRYERHVYQAPSPYMLPARAVSQGPIQAAFDAHVLAAIEG